MRVPVVPLSFCLALLACQTPPSPSEQAALVVDASYRRAVATPALDVIAIDPVTTQLLQATIAGYETQRRVLLENLANVDTWAYKRRVVRRASQSVAGSDGQAFQVPVVLGIDPVWSTGVLQCTGRKLDLAIDGDGFFACTLPDGRTGYTRNGQWQVNADGYLVSADGWVMVPEHTLPCDTLEVSIDPQGRFDVRTAGSFDSMTSLGQFQLARFVNPAGLRDEDGLFVPTEASGPPITNTPGSQGLGLLKQGFLERSNVQTANELLELQTLERQHECLVRVLRQFGFVAP